jgi:hypothetical protein
MSEELREKLIIILGVLDNLHDLYTIPSKNDSVEEKTNFSNIIREYKEFYLDCLNKNHINYNIEPFSNDIFNGLFNTNPITNINNKKDEIKAYFISQMSLPGILLEEINYKIIINFNTVFDIDSNVIPIFTNNLHTIINNDEKILLRIPLYHLIKNFTDDLFMFFINYFNLNILHEKYIKNIKKKVKLNIRGIINNLTYPNTYLSDTTSGLYQKRLFNFNILNISKSDIDQAKVQKSEKYFDNYDDAKNYQGLFLGNNKALGIKMIDSEDKLDYVNFSCYLNDHFIYCKLNRENILFKIKKNNIGRADEGYGLYQLLKHLREIINNSLECDINSILNDFYSRLIKFKDYKNKILEIFNRFNNSRISTTEIHDAYNRISITLNSDEKKKLAEKYKKFYAIIQSIKELKHNNNFPEQYIKIKNFLTTLLNASNKTINFRNINILKTLGLLSNDECINLLDYFNEIIKLNIDDEYIKHISKFKFDISEYIYAGKKTNKGLQFALYYHIYIKPIIKLVIDDSDLYMQLFNILNMYSSNTLVYGCLAFILLGAKRFGDWIQAQIAKKYYFMLQTDDKYCQLYSFLIGGTVILDKYIYNLEIPNGLDIKSDKVLRAITKDGDISNVDNNHIMYRGIKTIQTSEISRIYFYKYIKYKTKYYRLVKSITPDNNLEKNYLLKK